MAKNRKQKIFTENNIEKGLLFIDSFQKMLFDKDEKTVAISVRIPANVLRALKYRAEQKKQKYQSLLIDYLRSGLKTDSEFLKV